MPYKVEERVVGDRQEMRRIWDMDTPITDEEELLLCIEDEPNYHTGESPWREVPMKDRAPEEAHYSSQ